MNTIKGICDNINENPDDVLLWGILADALEEERDNRSEGIRWLIETNRKPGKYDAYYPLYHWWDEEKDEPGNKDSLPSEVYKRLTPYTEGFSYKAIVTLSAALLEAAKAYIEVKDSK